MAAIGETARDRFRHALLLASVVAMIFCWVKAALHLQESGARLLEAIAVPEAVLGAAQAAYADTPEAHP